MDDLRPEGVCLRLLGGRLKKLKLLRQEKQVHIAPRSDTAFLPLEPMGITIIRASFKNIGTISCEKRVQGRGGTYLRGDGTGSAALP